MGRGASHAKHFDYQGGQAATPPSITPSSQLALCRELSTASRPVGLRISYGAEPQAVGVICRGERRPGVRSAGGARVRARLPLARAEARPEKAPEHVIRKNSRFSRPGNRQGPEERVRHQAPCDRETGEAGVRGTRRGERPGRTALGRTAPRWHPSRGDRTTPMHPHQTYYLNDAKVLASARREA
jgi:hypothetical protein